MGRVASLQGWGGVLLVAFRLLVGWLGSGATVVHAIPPAPVAVDGSVQIGLSQPAPSPDGRNLVFVFAGDLWLTSMDGGVASRFLTTSEDEVRPFWSPDGRLLLFGRHEDRTQNIFVLDRETTIVRRLTEHEAIDVPSGFSRDGRSVLFFSDRSGENRLYEVPVRGGEPRPLVHDLSADACWISGDELVFVRSRMPWWRQRARGVGAGELFRFSRGVGHPRAVTSFEGVDLWPSYDADGRFIYYASEESFTRNVWRVHPESGVHSQITTHRTGAVDFPQVDRSGTRLVYEQGGSIWRVDLSADPLERKPSAARQLRILCPESEQTSRQQRWNVGARGLWVGPQSESIILEAEGHLFSLVDSSASEIRTWMPLAPSSYREDSPTWSPDGTRLVLTSDRAGQQDLLLVEFGNSEEPAGSGEQPRVRPFRSSFRNEYAPQFAPDGRFIAYLREYEEVEQLLLADPEGGREIVLAEGVGFAGMAFAPDGRWIAYSKRDRSGNTEIYLQSLFGGGEYNLSLHPSDDVEPSWSPDGRYLFFLSDRAGSRDVWAFALHREDAIAAGGGSWPEPLGRVPEKGVTVDLAGVADRLFQVTKLFGNEQQFVIDPSGSRLVFVSDVLGSPALWTRRWSEPEAERISRGWIPRVVRFDPSGRAVWSLDEHGVLRRCEFGGSGSHAAVETVRYSLSVPVDPRERREQILSETWRILDDGFYRPHFHLLDWEAVGQRYRDRLDGVHTEVDLNTLIRRMMGELNASHLGLRDLHSPRLTTGWLGVEVEADSTDSTGAGPGFRFLRVRYVLPGSPASRVGIEAGHRLLSVAGEGVGGQRPLESILRERAGHTVEVRWERTSSSRGHLTSDGERVAEITPIDTEQVRALERVQAVHRAREQVRNAVGPTLGYVRLDRIDRRRLDILEGELQVQQAGREGLILDLRRNLGGDLPEEFLRALQVRPALWREPRGERRQSAPTALWNKPLVVLIGPDTGSAAEIVARGISELGLGVLLGEPTAGGVIGAMEWDLVDGRQIRVPHVGWATLDGDNLEGRGVEPDIWIGETFERDRAPSDATIHAAILVLQDKVAETDRSRRLHR